MLTEYVSKMYEENEQKLNSLQREMDEIVNDINNAQTMMERLQYEKKLDTNIFSPRKIDTKSDEKINECRIKIKGMNQRMEYVSQMVEECLNNRKELTVLLKELQERNQKEQAIRNSKKPSDEENDCLNTYTAEDSETVICKTEKEQKNTLSDGVSDVVLDNHNLFFDKENNNVTMLYENETDKPLINAAEEISGPGDLSSNAAEEMSDSDNLSGNTAEEMSDSDNLSGNTVEEMSGLDNLSCNVAEEKPGPDVSSVQNRIPDKHTELCNTKSSENTSADSSENTVMVNIDCPVSDENIQNSIACSNIDENNDISIINSEKVQVENDENLKKDLLSFLNELYKHNEIALALVNGNKNRCKAEIRNSMSMIRDYAKKMENGES